MSNRRKTTLVKYARRGGMLVIGLPNLQRSFDDLHSGGGLILQILGDPVAFTELLIVSEERLDEIALEVGATRH